MDKNVVIPVVAGVGGLAVGVGTGYFVAKRRMEALMELRLQEEVASVKAAFNRGTKAAMFGSFESESAAAVDPQEQILALDQEAIEAQFQAKFGRTSKEGEGFVLTEDDVVKEGTVNIFDQAPILVAGYPNPDDENAPYLITVDQFHQEHDDYDKNSIVYYAGDLVLADETEAEIHDIPNTVGADFMEHFGDMSGDENIVYYRNDRLSIDFEISRDLGLYAEKVMGLGSEDTHEEVFEKIARRSKSRVRDDRDD